MDEAKVLSAEREAEIRMADACAGGTPLAANKDRRVLLAEIDRLRAEQPATQAPVPTREELMDDLSAFCETYPNPSRDDLVEWARALLAKRSPESAQAVDALERKAQNIREILNEQIDELRKQLDAANRERSDAVRYLATAQERIRELEAELCAWVRETGCESYAAAGDCVRSQEQRVRDLETANRSLADSQAIYSRDLAAEREAHENTQAGLNQARLGFDAECSARQRAEAQLQQLREACERVNRDDQVSTLPGQGGGSLFLHGQGSLARQLLAMLDSAPPQQPAEVDVTAWAAKLAADSVALGDIETQAMAQQPAEVAKPEAPASQRELAARVERIERALRVMLRERWTVELRGLMGDSP
jgi:hypothetical protein